MRPADPLLDRLVAVVVGTASPRRIILFGSRARGTAGEDSDYDLLVEKDALEDERLLAGHIYEALLADGFPAPVDVIAVDSGRLALDADDPSLVYREALREGLVVYG